MRLNTLKEPTLTSREVLFCYLTARLGNPREAAQRAGYAPARAEAQAARLLRKKEIRREIEEQEGALRNGPLRKEALSGLLRLALYQSNDAVELLEKELAPERRGQLDLFGVSQIRQNSRGLEIQFFDRLKALELLLLHGGGEGKTAESFFAALGEQAKAVWQGAEEQ